MMRDGVLLRVAPLVLREFDDDKRVVSDPSLVQIPGCTGQEAAQMQRYANWIPTRPGQKCTRDGDVPSTYFKVKYVLALAGPAQ